MGKRPASPPTLPVGCSGSVDRNWKHGDDCPSEFEIVIEADIEILVGDHEDSNLAAHCLPSSSETRLSPKRNKQNNHSYISCINNNNNTLRTSPTYKKSSKMETRPRSLSAHGPHPKKHDPIFSKIISGTLHKKYGDDKKLSSSPPSSPSPLQRRESFRRCTVLIPASHNNNNDPIPIVNTPPSIVKPKPSHHASSPKLTSSLLLSPPVSPPMSPPSSPPKSIKESPRTLLDSVKGTASSIKRAISCPVINSCALLDGLLHNQNKSPLLAPPFHASPPLSPHHHTPSPRFPSSNGMRTTPRATDANHKVTWWGTTNIGTRQENQDCYMLPNEESNKEFLFFGVFDGHGPEGKYASNCAKDTLQSFYEENITPGDTRLDPTLMRVSFLNAHNAILEKAASDFGTTAMVAGLHMPSSQLFFGWVGDSKAIICRKQKLFNSDLLNANNAEGNAYYAIELTRDHTLSLPEEMDRVYASGGVIRSPGGMSRVFLPELYSSFYGVKVGGLNMSRALGHMYLSRFGVIPDPDFGEEGLQPEDFVVLATDGLWGRMEPSEVAKFIGEKDMHSPKEISVALVEEVKARWGANADNITIVVLKTSHNIA